MLAVYTFYSEIVYPLYLDRFTVLKHSRRFTLRILQMWGVIANLPTLLHLQSLPWATTLMHLPSLTRSTTSELRIRSFTKGSIASRMTKALLPPKFSKMTALPWYYCEQTPPYNITRSSPYLFVARDLYLMLEGLVTFNCDVIFALTKKPGSFEHKAKWGIDIDRPSDQQGDLVLDMETQKVLVVRDSKAFENSFVWQALPSSNISSRPYGNQSTHHTRTMEYDPIFDFAPSGIISI